MHRRKVVGEFLQKKCPIEKGFQIKKIFVQSKVEIGTTRNVYDVHVLVTTIGRDECISFGGNLNDPPSCVSDNQLASAALMKQLEGYTLMTMKYVNTSHLIADCPKSMLPTAVLDFLCHLIDGYFLLGIPEMKSLNEAERLVIAARDAILNERQCPINHSNKFYELIPHKGDPMRRPALDNLKICNSKLIYVARMKATLEQLLIARQSGQKNPLDYFLANWLNADVGVLDRESQDFRTLERVAMRTQHPNASNKFRVSQIFTVNGGEPLTEAIESNHRYLFHHSFVTNLLGILRERLQVAPDHIHSVSRMFGKGIYMWNAVAYAGLQYRPKEPVYILVCRVDLGQVKRLLRPYKHSVDELVHVDDMDSAFCPGLVYGSVRDEDADLNGAKVYCGQIAKQIIGNDWPNYDIYVVPDERQVKIEYVMKLEVDLSSPRKPNCASQVPHKIRRYTTSNF